MAFAHDQHQSDNSDNGGEHHRRQPPRPGATGRTQPRPPHTKRQPVHPQRNRHHGPSFSEADTVRPLTDSRTTGVFGMA